MRKATCYTRLLNFIPLIRKTYSDWNTIPLSPFLTENNIPNEFCSSFFKEGFIIKKRITKPDNTFLFKYVFNKKTTNNDEEIAKAVYRKYSEKLDLYREKRKQKKNEVIYESKIENSTILSAEDKFIIVKILIKNDCPDKLVKIINNL